MKKLLCFLLLLFLGSIFVSCGISSGDAENIIIVSRKIFTCKDQNGYFRYIGEDLQLEERDYIELLEQNGDLTLTSEKNDKFYTGTKLSMLRARIRRSSLSKYYFENVPFIKEYFVGIKRTWKDKRKGYENRSYCEYKVKNVINKPYYDLLKDSGGKINTYISSHGLTDNYEDLSINRYLRHQKVGKIRILKQSFSKDSRGNWR